MPMITGSASLKLPKRMSTPAMLGERAQGIPRESYSLMTKVTTDHGADPRQSFEDMRRN